MKRVLFLLVAIAICFGFEASVYAGETDIELPDLGQAQFLGVPGDTLLMGGLVVCALGLLFGLMIYQRLKNLPVHS